MTWPQVVIAVWFASNIVTALFKFAKDRTVSSGAASVAFLFVIAIYVALSAVLHAGGFW